MPRKNGSLTPKEKAFSHYMARTNDREYAATRAGLAHPHVSGSQLMARPAVRDEVIRQAEIMLRDEILPLALATHKRLLTDKTVPAGAALGATKLAYDRTLGVDEGKADKEPSEMSYDELQASIETLRREQDARAESARDVTPEPGVFD